MPPAAWPEVLYRPPVTLRSSLLQRAPLLVLGATLGCGASARETGADARAHLADALERRDPVVLAARLESTPEVLTPWLLAAPRELEEEGRALRDAPLRESARVYLTRGPLVVLVAEEDGWRVDRGVLGAPVLATPTEALESFAVALRRIAASRVTAVLSRGTRLLMADELDRWRRGLEDVGAIPIVIEGDRASATLPTGVVIELVREAGEWRIDDLHD